MTTIYRYVIPADDKPHRVRLTGSIVHVDSRSADVVEFWATHNDDGVATEREFIVYGTGQPNMQGIHVGSVIVAGGALVWHLFEVKFIDSITAIR